MKNITKLSRPSGIIINVLITLLLYTGICIADVEDDLREASGNGDVNKVKILLSEGADVNDIDDQKRTALMWAAFNGHKDTA